jgi:hypothetical protein
LESRPAGFLLGASCWKALIIFNKKDEDLLRAHLKVISDFNQSKRKEPPENYQNAQQYILDTLNSWLDEDSQGYLKAMNISWDRYEDSESSKKKITKKIQEQQKKEALTQWLIPAERLKNKIFESQFTEQITTLLISYIEGEIQVVRALLRKIDSSADQMPAPSAL